MLPSEVRRLVKSHQIEVQELNKRYTHYKRSCAASINQRDIKIKRLEKELEVNQSFRFYYAVAILIILLQYLWSMV